MSLFSDYEAERAFAENYPFGVPGDAWQTKDGTKIKVSEMTTQHIKNCMRIVGVDDGWYAVFQEELKRRISNDSSRSERTPFAFQNAK